MPEISIITPVYNSARSVGRAIQSVIDQTFKNWEMILIDDLSTDESRDIIRSFASRDERIRLIESASNFGGPARPRNIGTKHAQSEYIAFLDSDDWWYPGKLEISLAHMDRADVVYHDLDIYVTVEKRMLKKAKGRALGNPAFVDLMTKGNALPNSSAVAKKKSVLDAGGFSEDRSLISVEDFDLWLRMGRTTSRFCYIEKSLGAYWSGGGNITSFVDSHAEAVQTLYNSYKGLLGEKDRRRAEATKNYYIGRNRMRAGGFGEARDLFKACMRSGDLGCRVKSMLSLAQIACTRKDPAIECRDRNPTEQ